MDQMEFDELIQKVSPIIRRRDTTMREAISPAERLSLTLRYLATGTNFIVTHNFHISAYIVYNTKRQSVATCIYYIHIIYTFIMQQ